MFVFEIPVYLPYCRCWKLEVFYRDYCAFDAVKEALEMHTKRASSILLNCSLFIWMSTKPHAWQSMAVMRFEHIFVGNVYSDSSIYICHCKLGWENDMRVFRGESFRHNLENKIKQKCSLVSKINKDISMSFYLVYCFFYFFV